MTTDMVLVLTIFPPVLWFLGRNELHDWRAARHARHIGHAQPSRRLP